MVAKPGSKARNVSNRRSLQTSMEEGERNQECVFLSLLCSVTILINSFLVGLNKTLENQNPTAKVTCFLCPNLLKSNKKLLGIEEEGRYGSKEGSILLKEQNRKGDTNIKAHKSLIIIVPSRMLPPITCILFLCIFLSSFSPSIKASFNLSLPHQHPYPEAVVHEVHRRVNVSLSRRELLASSGKDLGNGCLTGNPVDDCWRCDPNWAANRQKLADCGIGFGRDAMGGKGGRIYVVTDSSDSDPANPTQGTLRFGVIQDEPLWIIFSSSMTITLKHELIFNSFKTVDGRGANVHITGHGCLTLQYVSNVIIHNVHIHHCKPSGNTNIRSSPTHVGYRGKSDGDGISIFSSRKIWIDHCSLSYCTDGLVDAIMGSTGITISNSHFAHHDEVMLLGHDDKYTPDRGMQVTIAFNHFGEGLVQRMPRCRLGYIHVVNNDFTQWEMYAIGGSANPTINSQGNRYTAPLSPDAKEVTKRVDTDEGEWADWNWRTEGDVMVNGAFFVPSGGGFSAQYARASSVDPKSAVQIDQLTGNAGVFGDPRDNGDLFPGFSGGGTVTGATSAGNVGSSGGDDGDFFGMIFKGSGSSEAAPPALSIVPIFLSLLIISILYTFTNLALIL